MSNSQLKPSVISLGETFGALVVKGEGIEVEFRDGRIIVHSGNIELPAEQTPPRTASPSALKIGQTITKDIATDPRNVGLKYAGRATDGRHLLVEANDAMDEDGNRLRLTFREAAQHAAGKDMEVLPMDDLDLLYQRADKIGGFDRSETAWYMSASGYTDNNTWIQRFSDGYQYGYNEHIGRFVRCARRCSVI